MDSYSALRTDDSSEADSIDTDVPTSTKPKRSALGTGTLVVCVVCTVINIATTFFVLPPSPTKPQRAPGSYTPAEVRVMRRPNQYIGLEKITRLEPPKHYEFTNYPLVMLPIDSAHPHKAHESDPKKHASQVGTITPEVSRMLVTDTVSTVVQFRAIDFGMETCELNVLLPPLGLSEASLSALALYRLNASYAIDTATLTYLTRPPHIQKLADIPFDANENIHWHRKFACPTESLLTFELACSASMGHSCNIEWWQDNRAALPGNAAVFVTQHSTI